MWYVEVVHIETQEIVESIECNSEKRAERVEDGLAINLNWDEYETRIIFKGD